MIWSPPDARGKTKLEEARSLDSTGLVDDSTCRQCWKAQACSAQHGMARQPAGCWTIAQHSIAEVNTGCVLEPKMMLSDLAYHAERRVHTVDSTALRLHYGCSMSRAHCCLATQSGMICAAHSMLLHSRVFVLACSSRYLACCVA